MENEKETNLFEELKNLRIEKGISLETVAERSRIQIKYLESLENGDLLKIPEVYDKLFFKSYLKAIEVEKEEYIDRFLEFRQSFRVDKTTSVIQITRTEKNAERKIFNHRNLFVILPFSLIILVVALLLINTEMVGPSSEGRVQEIDIINVVDRIEAQEQAKLDSIQQEQEKSIARGLVMKVAALHKTWFRVVADKYDTTEYLLRRGQNIDIMADSLFEFLIGRADGLHLSLNEKDLGVPSLDSAVVRYMRIDSSGIAIKILKPLVKSGEAGESGENI